MHGPSLLIKTAALVMTSEGQKSSIASLRQPVESTVSHRTK